MASPDELACVYAALLLADDNVAITSDKINTVLRTAGVSVEPYWPSLFSKALDGVNVKELITSIGSAAGSAAPAAAAADAAPAAGAAKTEAKKEEKKVESEESDDDMGFGLFD